MEFVQGPVSLVACSALSALSLTYQALADVRRADKLSGLCSLYLLAVADSGERKTNCDNFFT
ncbi:MAG: YfjI family protein [Pseudomonadota bacterium]|nr:YfjI family protein [Pseudomonadota bacterium]